MAYAPAPLLWAAREIEKRIPSAVFSGIVAGPHSGDSYHHSANELGPNSYTKQRVGDRYSDGIDPNAACAIDISMSAADMRTVTGRFYRSWKDPSDDRLDTWREIIGTLDSYRVIYMDTQSGDEGTADNSHLSHLHGGGRRLFANAWDHARAFVSVAVGDSFAKWSGGAAQASPTPPPWQEDNAMHIATLRPGESVTFTPPTVFGGRGVLFLGAQGGDAQVSVARLVDSGGRKWTYDNTDVTPLKLGDFDNSREITLSDMKTRRVTVQSKGPGNVSVDFFPPRPYGS